MLNTKDLNEGDVALVGIPFDEKSSYLRGTAKGPKEILKALYSDSANLSTESIKDLNEFNNWKDAGIIEVKDYLNDITNGIITVLDKKALPVSLGGDHSITYPILKAIGKRYQNLTIIHLDAHSDLYDSFDGDRYSHACPFARIMEDELAE